MNTLKEEIRLAQPRFGQEALDSIGSVLDSGQLTLGPRVADFEHAVAAHVGVRHAVAVSSGTAALHLALVALGVGPGDEVIVPDFTHPATGHVVLQQRAKPVLVDAEPTTSLPERASARLDEVSRRYDDTSVPYISQGLALVPPAIDLIERSAG